MAKSLDEWLNTILSLHASRIDLGLERIRDIALENNLSSFQCPVITVAGTNGKGSCVRFLERIYSEAGYRVGAYYSPHIHRFNERIRLCEHDVDDATLIEAFERIESARHERPLSFFEFTTLAALSIFQSAKLDVVILEVGLGGRLDAVNIVDSDVAMVTSIAMDHMDWLGDDLDQIAAEKAGVYRSGKPAICGQANPPMRLSEKARECGATFYCLNTDFSYEIEGAFWSWEGLNHRYERLPMPLLKCQNAAASLMAIECLQSQLPVSRHALEAGLKTASLMGRFQQMVSPMNVVFDVAHNPDSARFLAERLNALPSARQVALVGMLETKDIAGTLEPLISFVEDWFVVPLSSDRAADSMQIMRVLKTLGAKNCYNPASVSEAVSRASALCQQPDDRMVVFGSFHTVAEVQNVLKEEV